MTCIQISQEAGKVVWYSHLLKNFPQFVVIHTVKNFSIVNEAEVDAYLEFSCFSINQWMLAIINRLETNEKNWEPQQRNRRYKEEWNENFRNEKYNNQNKKLNEWARAEWKEQGKKSAK